MNSVDSKTDWRKSRYAMVVSQLNCEISQMEEFIVKCLGIIKEICIITRCMSDLGR